MAESKTVVAQVVEPQFSKIVEGLRGAEGPVFDNHGNFFMVAPEVEKDGKYAGQILKVDLETGKATVLCEPSVGGFGGIPAGCQCDRDGNLWVADMRLGIIKVTQKGEFTQICTKDSEGRTIQGCNDCAFDYHGNLWVTAPAGEIAPHPYRRSNEEAFGSVYCLKNGQVHRVDTGILFPNGIAVSHMSDGRPKQLIVAETFTKLLWSYNIDNEGNLQNKSVWGRLSGYHEGGADGMDFDEAGSLLVAHWGSGFIEEPFGSVYCVTNEGVVRVDTGFLFPNGIAVLHDDDGCPKTLIVAETPTKRLWGYDIVGSGKLKNKRIWGQLPGDFRGPDGMDFDEHNNLLVTYQTSGSIEVFPPGGGEPTESIRCPFARPSNLHFRPRSRQVYVTEHNFHGLWRFQWDFCGKLQMCDLENV